MHLVLHLEVVKTGGLVVAGLEAVTSGEKVVLVVAMEAVLVVAMEAVPVVAMEGVPVEATEATEGVPVVAMEQCMVDMELYQVVDMERFICLMVEEVLTMVEDMELFLTKGMALEWLVLGNKLSVLIYLYCFPNREHLCLLCRNERSLKERKTASLLLFSHKFSSLTRHV